MSARHIPLGPIMLDVSGTGLTHEDRRRLMHPLTGGVILFSRNYAGSAQLAELTSEIHALRTPALIIAVDQEGGRVQRFREEFTAIAPMRELGLVWDDAPSRARELAHATGFVIAAELRAHGIDLDFAPVLDLDHGRSSVIGDRALHAKPQAVVELGRALIQGFREAGMGSVGKHFPGHGHVRADSHLAVPVDERSLADIDATDLVPFRRLVGAGLGGVMPAHVIYPAVDSRPAGFSPIWLRQVLRVDLGFDGAVFSDDLSMEGARVAGGLTQRAEAALAAGCDMVIVCHDTAGIDELQSSLRHPMPPPSLARLARLRGRPAPGSMVKLREDGHYTQALRDISGIGARDGELPLA
jgi:beta-N-acetylhexosaminidase